MEDYTVIQFNLTKFLKKKHCQLIKKLKSKYNEERLTTLNIQDIFKKI